MIESHDGVIERAMWNYRTDADLIACPWEAWDELRKASRAFSSSEVAPDWVVWTVMRYGDTREAMRRPDLFSSRSVVNVYSGPRLIDPKSRATRTE
jgi:hypothetical protein